jgi:hypothetical protein
LHEYSGLEDTDERKKWKNWKKKLNVKVGIS